MSVYNNISVEERTIIKKLVERTLSTVNELNLGNITTIRSYAFTDCTNITKVTIPDTVTTIGGAVFLNCTNLKDVTILATTPPILGSNAFNRTSLEHIYVPASAVNTYKANAY